MTFQIIAISSLLAFYGCYLGKMLLQKKQGIPCFFVFYTENPLICPAEPGTNGAGSLRPTTTFCLTMGRRVEGLAFWCIRIGFDWMLDKTEPEFVTIHRASRTVDEDSLSRVIIRLPGESIRCHKFRFRFVLQPSSR